MILTKNNNKPSAKYKEKILTVIKALYEFHLDTNLYTLSDYFKTLGFKRGHIFIYQKIKKMCIEQEIDINPESFYEIMELYILDRKKFNKEKYKVVK